MKDFKDRFIITARTLYGRDLNDLSKEELYQTLAATVKQYVSGNWIKTNRAYKDRGVKQVYYFSVEFLLGRLLNTNLVNLVNNIHHHKCIIVHYPRKYCHS